MADAKVIDARKVPSVTPDRVGKFDMLVTYQLSPLETFLLVLPAEGFTDTALHSAIRKDVEERGKIVGKTFSV